jgi:hypothetical protein
VASDINIPLVEAALGPAAWVASACGGVVAYQPRFDLSESIFHVGPGGRGLPRLLARSFSPGGQSIDFIGK